MKYEYNYNDYLREQEELRIKYEKQKKANKILNPLLYVLYGVFFCCFSGFIYFQFFYHDYAYLAIADSNVYMAKGEERYLNITKFFDEGKKQLTFRSDNDQILQIDETGKLHARGTGTANVTVGVKGSRYKEEIAINVSETGVPLEKIDFDKKDVTIKSDNSYQANVNVYPYNSTNQNIKYQSSDETIATVDQQGNIQPVNPGKVTISAVSDNEDAVDDVSEDLISDMEVVVVDEEKAINVKSIDIEQKEMILSVGDIEGLTYNILPMDATNQNVTWISSNKNVVSVNSYGQITGVSVGTAEITVVTNDGHKRATIKVHVTKNTEVENTISFSQKKMDVTIGSSAMLDYKVQVPETVVFTSSNPNVVRVDESGNVTSYQVGVATITGKLSNGNQATIQIEVLPILVTDIETNVSNISMVVGTETSVVAKVLPTNATTQTLTWSSDQPTIATVQDGIIKAVSAGECNVRVRSNNGKEKIIKVVVTSQEQPIEKIILNSSIYKVELGGSSFIQTQFEPKGAMDKNLKYQVADPTIATVDSQGRISGKKIGNTTVTVISSNQISALAQIEVSPVEATSISFGLTSKSISVGHQFTLKSSITPSNVTNKTVTYKSSNPNVATVSSNGVVSANRAGTTVITGTLGNKEAKLTLTVVNSYVSVSSITLNKKVVNLFVGSTDILKATLQPTNATNKKVIYRSSNSSIASVDETGKVTAKAPGTAKITVQSENGKTIQATVLVEPILPTGLALKEKSKTLKVNDTYQINPTILPVNATDKSITYQSDHENILTVNAQGVVLAKRPGQAKVTVKTINGKTASMNFTVKAGTIPVTKVSFNKTVLQLEAGSKEKVVVTVSPSNATNKSLRYTSSNPSIAQVDSNGVITAKQVGTATITATIDGKQTTLKVTVTLPKVKKITLNRKSITLKKSETFHLVATVSPTGAKEQGLRWSSSNTNVATVSSSGVVRAVGAGKATITARSKDGSVSASSTVTVTSIKIQNIDVGIKSDVLNSEAMMKKIKAYNGNKHTLVLHKGQTLALRGAIKISPANATNQSLSYTSSNKNVVSISSKGELVGKKQGTAVITIKAKDGSGKQAKIYVMVYQPNLVKPNSTGIKFKKYRTGLTMKAGNYSQKHIQTFALDTSNNTIYLSTDMDSSTGKNVIAKVSKSGSKQYMTVNHAGHGQGFTIRPLGKGRNAQIWTNAGGTNTTGNPRIAYFNFKSGSNMDLNSSSVKKLGFPNIESPNRLYSAVSPSFDLGSGVMAVESWNGTVSIYDANEIVDHHRLVYTYFKTDGVIDNHGTYGYRQGFTIHNGYYYSVRSHWNGTIYLVIYDFNGKRVYKGTISSNACRNISSNYPSGTEAEGIEVHGNKIYVGVSCCKRCESSPNQTYTLNIVSLN